MVMGVSSSGKTTIGEALGKHLGWVFLDGDDYHPAANVEKMRSGTPLTDEDRWPWLDRLRSEVLQAEGEGVVFACSALKERYRERLRAGLIHFLILHLVGTEAEIEHRSRSRVHRYMPASLVKSQFEALEPPADALRVSVGAPLEETVRNACAGVDAWLQRGRESSKA